MSGTETQGGRETMTAGENAQIVQRAYEAINSADMDTLTALFDESASWHTPRRSPVAGDNEGREAVFAQFGRYGGEAGRTFKAALQRVFESDDGCVVGVHHNSAERNGEHLDTGCCIVFEIKDERITDGREHFFDLYNWDGFWS